MKRAFIALLLATLLAFAAPARAQKPQSDFRDTLSAATLAVYAGRNVCEFHTVQTWFGPMQEWGCQFESHFTCTATVVGGDGEGSYLGLTAGHCFNWDAGKEKYKYYVSDGVNEHPVLCEIKIVKFENDDRYDYGVFTFASHHNYPRIQVAGMSGSSADPDHVIPALGSKIVNVNFSFGIVKEVVEGPVVSKQISEVESTDAPKLRRRYLVQIPFGPGASGSAIVNENSHEIVGLTEAMFPGTQMAAVVIPTGHNLRDFLEDDSAGIKPEDPPKTAPAPKDGTDSRVSFVLWLFRFFLL